MFLSIGAIVGIVGGVLGFFVLICIAILIFQNCSNRKQKRLMSDYSSQMELVRGPQTHGRRPRSAPWR